jgi:hypothetical protein
MKKQIVVHRRPASVFESDGSAWMTCSAYRLRYGSHERNMSNRLRFNRKP